MATGIYWLELEKIKTRIDADKILLSWAQSLREWRDAEDLLLPGIVSELVPDGFQNNSSIEGAYEQGFRERVYRLCVSIWIRRRRNKIAEEVFKNACKKFDSMCIESEVYYPGFAQTCLAKANPRNINMEEQL